MERKTVSTTIPLIILLSTILVLFIGSCSIFESGPVVMTPPSIPGASYVGWETCADCHQKQYQYFELSDHAGVAIDVNYEDAQAGQAEACETCHGPASLHLENPIDKSRIIRSSAETCFNCHLNIKGQFMLQHHHPVPEGKMSCSDCHDPHGKDVRATGGVMLLGQDEKCFNCHKEIKGPFVFEHEAMREGCSVCHNPHGSINDKLLVAGPTITCIRCHFQPQFNTDEALLGSESHDDKAIGRGADCIDCHTRVHGSNNAASSLRF